MVCGKKETFWARVRAAKPMDSGRPLAVVGGMRMTRRIARQEAERIERTMREDPAALLGIANCNSNTAMPSRSRLAKGWGR
jgi:hypothetical protein